MGQTLLPEHFEAQEEAFAYENALRSRLRGLPAFGIASMRWNDRLLAEGVLSITTATLVLQSGLLLDVPGNATADPLNLTVPGTSKVSAYLHLMSAPDESDAGWGGDDGSVPRVTYRIVLSADQSHAGAVESMKLAEFEKDPEGIWSLSPAYIPPLLLLGTTPFLRAEFEALGHSLEGFQYKLMMDSVSYMSGSGLYTVRQCLKGVFHMKRFLANLRGQVHSHPYYAYEALKDFYVEVAFYRDSAPRDVAEPYKHNDLATCFKSVLEPLAEQMQLAQKKSPYLPFKLQDGVYEVVAPSAVKEAKEVYFLIQKDQIHRTVTISDLKLASRSRLSTMHTWALAGVPLKKIDRPALAHSFGPEVEFYQLGGGDEWDRVVRESSIAFYDRAEFQDLEFYLYWYVG